MENWRCFEQREALLTSEAYVTKVLGISIPLNESYPYSSHLQDRILREQLIFEGFFSDIKEMPGQIGEFWKALRDVWSDPNEVEEFYKEVDEAADEDMGPILKFFTMIRDEIGALVKMLSNAARKLVAPLIGVAKKVLSWYEKIEASVKGLSGLKKAVGVTALALAIQYIWDKVGDTIKEGLGKVADLIPVIKKGAEGVVEETLKVFAGWFVGSIGEKVVGFIKEKLFGVMKNVLGDAVSGGAKKVWDVLTKLYGGAAFVIKTLYPAIKDFNAANVQQAKGAAAAGA